ncbi:fructose-1,6-bisphosphatase [Clostridia bacterium OttesenSCG-928-O13]|nr:fructose-1,6-bisphosphatase [Clostridia bacterium OttesenSCG-928-O13]
MIDRHYLELLAREYPTISAVSSEIINLAAICQLPKGTEYFFSDIHGEADAFSYLLGTASGVIGSKIEALFQNSLTESERLLLSELIYRPKHVLRHRCGQDDSGDWCRVTIFHLVQVCKAVSGKYTRSKVRKKMPARFAYVMDELLHADTEENKEEYYTAIIDAIIGTGMAQEFIEELCNLVRRCSIDQLHIIGDIFDRGPHADLVMEELMRYGEVDVQWGNHDIQWMGAVAGNQACVAGVVRLAISYNNFDLLEDSYGINLRPLSAFAAKVYADDPCELFRPHLLDENIYDPIDEDLAAKMHKAIAIIQFKLEGQLIARHPEYGMNARAMLNCVDFEKGTLSLESGEYPMRDMLFPTVDAESPLALTEGEEELVRTLTRSFTHSPMLTRHIQFLYNNGGLYKIANGNLLYHGCIPMNENGGFRRVEFEGKALSGRAYLNAIETKIRDAYYAPEGTPQRADAGDFIWYLWCGKNSPIFGKSHLSTFERYFVADKKAHVEHSDPYYRHVNSRAACEKILREFGLDPATSRIINGHVPVRLADGESPIKGDGLLFVIDGGISKAYQSKTGIGGYTLLSNSHYLALAEHRPFQEVRGHALGKGPKMQIVERFPRRVQVKDTDTGKRLQHSITELQELLRAYREGELRQQKPR